MTRRRILVPINFTKESDAALSYAGKIAGSMNEMITCLYVMEDHEQASNWDVTFEAKNKMRREAEQNLSVRVNKILSGEHSTEFEIIISSGNVHLKVLEKAIDLDARLIVMGESNSSKVPGKRIGSNTEQILLKSPIPVITICDSGTRGIKNKGINVLN